MNILDGMPQLIKGTGKTPQDGGCLIQVISYLWNGAWTDTTPCVHPVLRRAAIAVNDRVTDEQRQRLYALVPSLMGTQPPDDQVAAKRLSVGLAVWCARRVLPLVREQDRQVCENAIVAAEGWLAGTVTEDAAYAAAYATYAADAADAATYAAAYAVDAADAARAAAYAADAAAYAEHAAAYAAASPMQFLTDLIAEYDRLTGRIAEPALTDEQVAACLRLREVMAG